MTGKLLEDVASIEANKGEGGAQKPIVGQEGGVRSPESVGGEVRGMSSKQEEKGGKVHNRDEIGEEGVGVGKGMSREEARKGKGKEKEVHAI